jgi:hypothetical protein
VVGTCRRHSLTSQRRFIFADKIELKRRPNNSALPLNKSQSRYNAESLSSIEHMAVRPALYKDLSRNCPILLK